MKKQHLTIEEATEFFSEYYGGAHHIPNYKVDSEGYGFSVTHDGGGIATFDGNGLTRLVLMAHEKCIRVSVNPKNSRSVKIYIHKRFGTEGSIGERHPTIEMAIENYRKCAIK